MATTARRVKRLHAPRGISSASRWHPFLSYSDSSRQGLIERVTSSADNGDLFRRHLTRPYSCPYRGGPVR
jgi:hypothetical protein